VAFSSGTVGAIYRQFALTIVAAMLLSVFVALTLTPPLCATVLKPAGGDTAQAGLLRLVQPRLRGGTQRYGVAGAGT
jgi:multidrug efflux pump